MTISQFDKKKPVITTVFVVKQKSPITEVVYDTDGDLQMLGDEDSEVEDAMVLSLEQMLDLDKTLLDLPDLEQGMRYLRNNIGENWQSFKD